MGRVAGELPLGGKGIVQPLQHLVERTAQLPEFRNNIFVDPHIGKIVQLHLLHLRGKASQGLESCLLYTSSLIYALDRLNDAGYLRRGLPSVAIGQGYQNQPDLSLIHICHPSSD